MKNDYHHPIDAFGILKVSMSGIRIENLEDRINPLVPFPHKHDFFQIILMTQGSGHHRIDFEKYQIAKNQIFVMKPGQVHSWQLSKNISGLVVEFNRGSVPELYEELFYSSDELKPGRESFQVLKTLTDLMKREFLLKRDSSDMALRHYLVNFILELKHQDQKSRKNSPLSGKTLEDFRKLVEENYRVEHRVEFYAKKLRMTPKALTMQITRVLGKSPRLLIQERFLLEAKRLLAFSKLSVAEIGYELGFIDANYFTRFFRQHVKKSPAQFRKEVS
jgi:AraC-like DNA-binding protein